MMLVARRPWRATMLKLQLYARASSSRCRVSIHDTCHLSRTGLSLQQTNLPQRPQQRVHLCSSVGTSAPAAPPHTQLRWTACHAAAVDEQTESAAAEAGRTPFERLGVDSRLAVRDLALQP